MIRGREKASPREMAAVDSLWENKSSPYLTLHDSVAGSLSSSLEKNLPPPWF
jgi:hypothetical protein